MGSLTPNPTVLTSTYYCKTIYTPLPPTILLSNAMVYLRSRRDTQAAVRTDLRPLLFRLCAVYCRLRLLSACNMLRTRD